jgi:hypothetical protein
MSCLLRWPDVRQRTGLSRLTVSRLEREGRFPRRVAAPVVWRCRSRCWLWPVWPSSRGAGRERRRHRWTGDPHIYRHEHWEKAVDSIMACAASRIPRAFQ